MSSCPFPTTITITPRALFNAKAIFLEEQEWCYLTRIWKDSVVHTFPKGICPKVKVVAQLEFERAYYDTKGQRFTN